MRCTDCGNDADFDLWLDLGLRVNCRSADGRPGALEVWEFHRAVCETMPLRCRECSSDEVQASEEEWETLSEHLVPDTS